MTEPDRLPLWPDVLSVCAWLGIAMAGAYGLRAMPWRHPVALWVLVGLLGLVVGLAVVFGVGSASAKLRARRRRYWVRIEGKRRLIYVERALDSHLRRLAFDCLRVPLGPWNTPGWDVRVPSEADWLRGVPEWARERRADILQRIVDMYGGGTRFRFSEPTPTEQIRLERAAHDTETR